MGSGTSKETKDESEPSSLEEKKDKPELSSPKATNKHKRRKWTPYPITIHKIRVTLTPWGNDKRLRDPPLDKLEDNEETFESTVFGIHLEPLPDDVLNNEDEEDQYEYPAESVVLKTALATTIEKHKNGCVRFLFPLRVTKILVEYVIHTKTNGTWTKRKLLTQVAPGTVDLEINQDDFDMEACFLTSRRVYDDVSLGANRTYVYTNELSRTEQIIFPQGGVKNDTDVRISAMMVDANSKRDTLKPESGIQRLSNIIYVNNCDNLQQKAMLTIKMDDLYQETGPSQLCVFHCDEENGVQIVSTPITGVAGYKDLFQIEVDHFSGYGIAQGRSGSVESFVSGISSALDVGYTRCKILLFACQSGKELSLWSEIVPEEEELVNIVRQKRINDGLVELRKCRSQKILIRNMERIRVTVPSNVGIKLSPESSAEYQFIQYDIQSYENFVCLPIAKNERHGHEMAYVYYNRDKGDKRLLHQAHFAAYAFFTGGLKAYVKASVAVGPRSATEPPMKGNSPKQRQQEKPIHVVTNPSISSSTSTSMTDVTIAKVDRGTCMSPKPRVRTASKGEEPKGRQSKMDVAYGKPVKQSPVQATPTFPASFFSEKNLFILASQLTVPQTKNLGILLDLADKTMTEIQILHHADSDAMKRAILKCWMDRDKRTYDEKQKALLEGLEFMELRNIAEVVTSVWDDKRSFALTDFMPNSSRTADI